MSQAEASPLEGRPVSFSQTTLTELMVPSYANFGGKVHGGMLLSLMDKLAYVCAMKHAGTYCVTVSVDTVEFLRPVEVGELVSMLGSVNYVGTTSLVVGIKVLAEDIDDHTQRHTNTSYFTMVAKDDNGDTTAVPPLILENDDQIRRFCSALQRKQIRAGARERMRDFNDNFALTREVGDMLTEQRCIVSL